MADTIGVEKIGFDVPVQEVYPSFVERYFTPRYVLDVHSKGDDICVLFHSNRACLIVLAPSHPVLAKGKNIVKVDYEATESEEDQIRKRHKHRNESTNRLGNRVRGKKKRGAQILHKKSLLCKIELEDGSIHAVRSGIPGLLVEINEQLIENPNLVLEKPSSEGYIAIMLPKTLESDRLRDKLMTPEQYQKAVEERDNGTTQLEEQDKTKTHKMEEDQESVAGAYKVEQNGKASTVADNIGQDQDSTTEPVKVEHTHKDTAVAIALEQDKTEKKM